MQFQIFLMKMMMILLIWQCNNFENLITFRDSTPTLTPETQQKTKEEPGKRRNKTKTSNRPATTVKY